MKALKFLVRYPDGRGEEFIIESDRVLIGSGAHCEIRLPVDMAAIEHVAVSLGPTSAFAEARAFQPQPTLNGSPFAQAPLLSDAVLGIGQVTISVAVIDLSGPAGLAPKSAEKSSVLTYILAIVVAPIALYIILSDSDQMQTPPAPTDVPELWETKAASCPQRAQEQALAVANEKLALADARRERRPFHVQDGVAAVPLYELAASCFDVAGEKEASKEASEAGKELRAQVSDDYRTHRVRLEHAVSVKDWSTAQSETKVLLAFTEGKQGQYVTWLSNLDRRLQLKFGRKGH